MQSQNLRPPQRLLSKPLLISTGNTFDLEMPRRSRGTNRALKEKPTRTQPSIGHSLDATFERRDAKVSSILHRYPRAAAGNPSCVRLRFSFRRGRHGVTGLLSIRMLWACG